MALAPSFCSYGEQVARERVDKLLDETTLDGTYEGLSKSGMQTKLYVVDGGWESGWGNLEHSKERLPGFDKLLARVRADGQYLGLWSAFMRCERPDGHGADHRPHAADARRQTLPPYRNHGQPVLHPRLHPSRG